MVRKAIIAVLFSLLLATSLYAGVVNGYFRSNGTYVAPHFRSNPNNTTIDNYSYRPPKIEPFIPSQKKVWQWLE